MNQSDSPLTALMTVYDVRIWSPIGRGHLIRRPPTDTGRRCTWHIRNCSWYQSHRVQEASSCILCSLQASHLELDEISVKIGSRNHTSLRIDRPELCLLHINQSNHKIFGDRTAKTNHPQKKARSTHLREIFRWIDKSTHPWPHVSNLSVDNALMLWISVSVPLLARPSVETRFKTKSDLIIFLFLNFLTCKWLHTSDTPKRILTMQT